MLAPLIAALGVLGRTPAPALIPKPLAAAWGQGEFRFKPKSTIEAEGEAAPVGKSLRSLLRMGRVVGRGHRPPDVALRLVPSLANLGDEGYRLRVTPSGIEASAAKPAGLFYAVQTLRQMLPPAVESTHKAPDSWSIRCVEIEDKPRFSWRGMHLDVSRHFFTPAEIEKYIDQLSMLKMNVFHWHLVDDGGWRIEIKKYPLLTQIGSWRNAFEPWDQSRLQFLGPKAKEPQYGGFYTQSQVREIVKYAKDRFVTVVPEIEMPGHTMPSIAAYPNLACTEADRSAFAAESGNRIPNVYCPGKDSTFEFLENVLTEVMELFPSTFIHIGGDEVDKTLWHACPDCQSRMRAEGLKDEQELQSYFVKRIEKFLNSKGRRLMGWDEILEGGLAPNAAVMSWRGEDGGIAAAKAGHDVVMTPGTPMYFDGSYRDNSVERVFQYDPIPQALTEEEGKHILGVQANIWTEHMLTYSRVEQMTMPRMLSAAEIAWVPRGDRRYDEFQIRVGSFFERLEALGIDATLPVPRADQQVVFLDKPTEISFVGAAYQGLTIRYTLDGAAPKASSPQVSGPIRVSTPCTITAAYVSPDGKVGDVATVSCIGFKQSDTTGLQPGLSRSVYNGKFDAVPDFLGQIARTTSVSDWIGLSPSDGKVNFALKYSGYIQIPSDGVYTFHLTSDDGSWMKIQGAKLLNNDGPHPPVTVDGSVLLKSGVYEFEIAYFQASGGLGLDFVIEGPNLPLQPIPTSWLFHK